jgi:hypothetical protein
MDRKSCLLGFRCLRYRGAWGDRIFVGKDAPGLEPRIAGRAESIHLSFTTEILSRDDLGHFIDVLDQYKGVYPYSSLPKKLALGLVAWILCFMGLLASGVGR